MAANKTLFITIDRPSPAIDWGFEFIENEHKRLGSILMVQHLSCCLKHTFITIIIIKSSSPAYEAGLLPGDILIGIDNSPITGRPLTYSLAKKLLIEKSPLNRIELQILRDPKNRVRKLIETFKIINNNNSPIMMMNRGVIPSVAQMDSGIRMPDNNIEQFLNEKAREQWAITKQTYRTVPIIEPKPKVRRDWPMGSYLKYMEGPGWHDPPKHIMVQEGKFKLLNQLGSTEGSPVHRQYNSPINLYSESNLQNSLNLSAGPSSSISPQPVYKLTTTKPETIDITNSPTYQFLQEERYNQQHRPPTTTYSAFNRTSPEPQQTPYFKTLMHTLNVS